MCTLIMTRDDKRPRYVSAFRLLFPLFILLRNEKVLKKGVRKGRTYGCSDFVSGHDLLLYL